MKNLRPAVFLAGEGLLVLAAAGGREALPRPAAPRFLRGAKELGRSTILLSDRRGASPIELGREQRAIRRALAAAGAQLDASVPPRGETAWSAEAILRAALELRIDPDRSVLVAEDRGAVRAGRAAGMVTVLIVATGSPAPSASPAFDPEARPDRIAADLDAVLHLLRAFVEDELRR
jgi:hypothetical protein